MTIRWITFAPALRAPCDAAGCRARARYVVEYVDERRERLCSLHKDVACVTCLDSAKAVA